MALKVTKDFKGITIQDAYVRVDRVFGGKREGWNSLIGVYANSEATEPIEQFNCFALYEADEANPYTLLYAAIKALEGFEEAVDC